MEFLSEEILIYSAAGLLCAIVIYLYLRKQIKTTKITEAKIEKAKEDGLHEPISLHPVVNANACIQTGACISACPEKDILGIKSGKATTINASQCIGHGACFHACPTEAIMLCIGTEKRGVDLPHVNQQFQSNVPGLYIAGELGGMGLIKNAVEQGKQAIDNLAKTIDSNHKAELDLIIIGAGPAGIGAALLAKKKGLKFKLLEQDSLGGTVYTFPRSKIVMTSPMELPLYGKIKLYETTKTELIKLWSELIKTNEIPLIENSKVEAIEDAEGNFQIHTLNGDFYSCHKVLLAIGRRGSPRKLGIPGEMTEKVAYRLLEPEDISAKKILVVGGGDSAVEAALLLMDQNNVILSYRSETFKRIKPDNRKKIQSAIEQNKIEMHFNSHLKSIEPQKIKLFMQSDESLLEFDNDLVYIFAGGELPTTFLEKTGVTITRKFGEALLKHEK